MAGPGGIGNSSDLADFVLNNLLAPASDFPDRPEAEWIPVWVHIKWRLWDPTTERGIATAWTRDEVKVTVLDQKYPMREIWVAPADVKRRED